MARVTTNFATEWASYRQSSEPGSWSDNIAPQVVQIGTNGAGFGFEEAHDPQMVTWEALRSTNRAEVDALVRVRCTSHPTPAILRGVSLFARLPHQPYTPGVSLAHTLNRQGSMLRIHWGVFVPSGLVPPDARVDLGASMTIGDWHWMRLQVTRTDTHETVRGKMWVDGQPEPDWQVTHTDTLESDVLPAVGGAIGVGNGGNGGWNFSSFPEATYEWDYAEDLFAPGAVPQLDSPVTLHMSESLTGVFADPSIDATFFSLVDLPIGARHSLGDQISNQPWYNFTVRDKSVQGGLVSYSGETLLARLDRIRPTESLILVAGQNDVPDPLTLREVLVRFLDYYGVPYDPDVPEFYLRVGDEILVPTVPAFAIQPDTENPESVYALLEPWWGVFRQYTFRADIHDRLKVTPPAWVDTIGARLNLWRRRQDNDRTPTNSTARVPWTTARRPTVEWVATVDGVPFSGALPTPLEHGAPIGEFSVGPIIIRIQWRTSDNNVQASVWPPPPNDRTIGSLYQITLVLRPESLPGDEVLELTLADLDPADVVSSSADTVINQVVIPHRERTFLPNQQLMQAGALVLRSPVQTAAGAFGANFEFGPMAEELETPNDFLELANEVAQAGTWFWPVDDGVIIQPGGNVTVAYEVEEWAEMWGHNNIFLPQPAEEVNTHSGTVELPANGAEVQLFQFQFPRRTWATSIGGYQAQGRVYGRWRAGENPGIEVRVGNSRFVEFGYLPEFLGVFGQSVYFLWGAIIKLNGTGTTFTSGELTTYRFGFSRGEDGTWEGGANVPGLSESQALYPNRVYTAPELPYSITPEVGLALARGIVEENLTPKVVRTLTLVPARAEGYAAGPWHMGRAVRVPALGVEGRLTSIDWAEAHTAQAQGDTSQLTIDIESTAAPEGSRAAATTYRRAAYGLSHYQQEE